MSWGERSCKHINGNCPVPDGPTMSGCNVDCPMYLHDGVTEPDSKYVAGRRERLDERIRKVQVTSLAANDSIATEADAKAVADRVMANMRRKSQ